MPVFLAEKNRVQSLVFPLSLFPSRVQVLIQCCPTGTRTFPITWGSSSSSERPPRDPAGTGILKSLKPCTALCQKWQTLKSQQTLPTWRMLQELHPSMQETLWTPSWTMRVRKVKKHQVPLSLFLAILFCCNVSFHYHLHIFVACLWFTVGWTVEIDRIERKVSFQFLYAIHTRTQYQVPRYY